jgi:hypothetical protein
MVAMCRRPLKARETGLFFIKFTSFDMLGGEVPQALSQALHLAYQIPLKMSMFHRRHQ